MKIFLVRHGETDWNSERKIQGALDFSQLSENGINQATNLMKFLEGKFDVICSSPRKRAYMTAEIISKGKKIITHGGLIERDYGVLNGRKWSEIEVEMPEFINVYMETRDLSGIEGSESLEALQKRSWEAFVEIIESNKGKNIAIVSHGGPNRVIIAGILGIPLNNIGKLEQSNCCINEIDYNHTEKKFKIRGINHIV